jgi:hypothetical protein
VATHDDKHPEMLDEELRPLQMYLELYDFVHRQGDWARVQASSLDSPPTPRLVPELGRWS